VELERRLLVGVFTPIGRYPVPEGSFVDTDLSSDLGDRTRVHDDHLHGFILELGGERPSFLRHVPSLSR
jgi:hypothetical protein